jgi:chromosome partitioning protein
VFVLSCGCEDEVHPDTNFKGGVAKTTTAVHIANLSSGARPTLLIDGDPNRSATEWKRRGALPFEVLDPDQRTYHARNYEHVVIDTEAGCLRLPVTR